MKQLFIACTLLLLFSTLSAQEVVVERPPFSVSNTQALEIEKIVLDKEKTVIYFTGYNHPGWWQRIDSQTYIVANGRKLIVLSADGIELDKKEVANAEGKLIFSLNFPPIDPDTRHIDFIESDCDDCFKIWGIELQSNVLTHKIALPEEVKNTGIDFNDPAPLPIPELKRGDALLKGRLAGYRPEMKFSGEIYISNPAVTERTNISVAIREDGTFETVVPVISTTTISFFIEEGRVAASNITVSPGEETFVFYDLQQKARQEARTRIDKETGKQWVYFGGANAEINNQKEEINKAIGTQFNFRNLLTDIYGKSADAYKTYILQLKEKAVSELDSRNLTRKARDFADIQLNFTSSYYLMMGGHFLKESYRRKHNLSYEDDLSGYEEPVYTQAYFDFLKEGYINHPLALYSNEFSSGIGECGMLLRILHPQEEYSIQRVKELLAEILGTNQGIAFDMLTMQSHTYKLEQAEVLTEADLEAIAQLPDAFYPAYARYLNESLLAQIELNKNKKGYNVHEAPEAEGDAILHEIVKPFKGKVLFIDFWATWCGPCRMAMKQFEPAKEQFKDKEVAFIYLTDYSSPKGTWDNMIANIPGEHFRLENEQFKYLKDKFGVRGVPSYLILNKKGEQVYFKVGFEGAETISRILTRELEL